MLPELNLYGRLKAAGVPLDSHESDLYAKVTPESWRLVNEAFKRGEVSRGGVTVFLLGAWHHVNCHTPGCKRIGRHRLPDPDTGELHLVCPKCHPAAKPKAHWWSRRVVHTLDHIHAQYRKGIRQ